MASYRLALSSSILRFPVRDDSEGGAYSYDRLQVESASNPGGRWTKEVLYNFADAADGAIPLRRWFLTRLLTVRCNGTGGDLTECNGYGCGTISNLLRRPSRAIHGLKRRSIPSQ